MIIGTLVGVGVQKALQSTGLMGPDVGTLIAEQQSNFAEVKGKLDALRKVSSDPAAQTRVERAERGPAEAERPSTADRTAAETHGQRKVHEQGTRAGGAWGVRRSGFLAKSRRELQPRDARPSLGLQGYGNGVAQVSLNGAVTRLAVGGVVEFMAGQRACKVFYKQATPRQTGAWASISIANERAHMIRVHSTKHRSTATKCGCCCRC